MRRVSILLFTKLRKLVSQDQVGSHGLSLVT